MSILKLNLSSNINVEMQISANNSTLLRYLKKTLNNRVLFGVEYYHSSTSIYRRSGNKSRPVLTLVFDHFQTGLVFVLCVNTILEFQNQASTRLRAQTFKISLDNESRVGTPLRRNLLKCNVKVLKACQNEL